MPITVKTQTITVATRRLTAIFDGPDLVELRTLDQARAAGSSDLLHNRYGSRRLHADVIRLDGCDGLLERIVFTPLQRHSGMLLYGVTLEIIARRTT